MSSLPVRPGVLDVPHGAGEVPVECLIVDEKVDRGLDIPLCQGVVLEIPRDGEELLEYPCKQCSRLSLVEVQRLSFFIGRELLSVAGSSNLLPQRTTQSPQLGICSSLVLYGMRIVGFHARKGPIIGALMP